MKRLVLTGLAHALLVSTVVIGCSTPPSADADTFGASVQWDPHLSADVSSSEPDAIVRPAPDVIVATPDAVQPDTSVTEVVTWDVSGPETSDGPCNCDGPTHCSDEGVCAPDVCEKGVTTCAGLDAVLNCANNGGSFDVETCFPGQVCQGGVCVDPICEPNTLGGCAGTGWLACNSLGTEWVIYPCPLDAPCQAGACRPVEPNVLLVIDTSGSMNWTPSGDNVSPCDGPDCEAPWLFPICDNPEAPVTRLGRVKAALNTVTQSETAASIRLALQRFPQRPFEPGTASFNGGDMPQCDGGYWIDNEGSWISGDDGSHVTSMSGWFGAGLSEVIIHPFGEETHLDVLAQWFDFTEEAVKTETLCESADGCAGGPCVEGHCLTTVNPELRGSGPTPLGKSLFYAGEYLRHEILVEGKPCLTDLSCDSPHHICEGGTCHDPFGHCRDTIVIVFTDGDDTRNVATSDFFNPRVQAKRLHYGLGCDEADDCLAGAACEAGVCRSSDAVAFSDALVCDAGGDPCTSDNQCDNPCQGWDECEGGCAPTEPTLTSSQGADHLTDYAGNRISLRVHVVDASGVEGKNSLIAAFGGGHHFSVDLEDPDALVASVFEIIGDTKNTTPCAAE
jgi:hypothetical protein